MIKAGLRKENATNRAQLKTVQTKLLLLSGPGHHSR